MAFCSRPEDVHEADELDEIVPTSALMIVLFTLVSCPGMLSNCKQCGKNGFWAIMFVLSLLAFKMALTTRRLAEVKVYFSLLYDD